MLMDLDRSIRRLDRLSSVPSPAPPTPKTSVSRCGPPILPGGQARSGLAFRRASEDRRGLTSPGVGPRSGAKLTRHQLLGCESSPKTNHTRHYEIAYESDPRQAARARE